MEVKFKITLMRPTSRSWLCSFILKGLVWDLLFLLLKDGLSLLRVSGVPLCSPLSVFWVCMVCSLHPCMMDQGTIPATLTAVGVVRITYGPFHQGASKPCFQSLSHTWSPSVNSWICSPRGNGTLSCTNLVTRFITLPSSICCDILSPPPYLRQICWHLFYYGRGPPIHNFVWRIALGLWGHPESEQSRWKQVHSRAASLSDPLGESL